MIDQRRWHEGDALPYGNDLELDRADHEPSIGVDTREFDICDLGEQPDYHPTAAVPFIEEVRSHYAASTGSEVGASPALDPDGKPGVLVTSAPRGRRSMSRRSKAPFSELEESIRDMTFLAQILLELGMAGESEHHKIYAYTGDRLYEHAERAREAFHALLEERRDASNEEPVVAIGREL